MQNKLLATVYRKFFTLLKLIKKNFYRKKIFYFSKNDIFHNCHFKNSELNFNINYDKLKNCKSVRIDIGLSNEAPTSALWLNNCNNIFVCGIEANKYCVEYIKREGIYHSYLKIKHYNHKHFHLIHGAVSDVVAPTFLNFYSAKSEGTSSLLPPTNNFFNKGESILETYKVLTFPLKILTNQLLQHFPYIEAIKVDTQGSDLNVIKSLSENLKKVIFVVIETDTLNCYKSAPRVAEIDKYFKKFDFKIIGKVGIDFIYFNTRYKNLRNKIKFSYENFTNFNN
jgi:hypothetical protein